MAAVSRPLRSICATLRCAPPRSQPVKVRSGIVAPLPGRPGALAFRAGRAQSFAVQAIQRMGLLQIIPVIDLRQGDVVHARLGERARYRPLQSILCEGSAPAAVVEGLM